VTQAELFEPRADECAPLAASHLRRAEQFKRAAEVFASRGWSTLEVEHRRKAAEHEAEAECLAMYHDLLRRAGVVA
jgi:hypothetical protein